MSDEHQMPQLPGVIGWVLAACVSIGILLSGVIKWMYTKIESMYATQLSTQKEQIQKVEERCKALEGHYEDCNQDREQLRIQSAENRARIEMLENQLGMRK